MSGVREFLQAAEREGVISPETAMRLEAFRQDWPRQGGTENQGGFLGELDERRDADEGDHEEPSEAPRFIRGFHDVLITIGILVALGGLWALTSSLWVIVAVIGLSEVFVARQRLALPAFTLTLALVTAVTVTTGALLQGEERMAGITIFSVQLAALAAYYWRYRVPVALAALIWAGFGVVFFLVLLGLDSSATPGLLVEGHPRIVGLVGLILTGAMFAVAMRFDLADRMRVTRRSDVAFWLHLVTAPLLLASAFLVLFGSRGFLRAESVSVPEAMAAIGMVTLLMLIGIIIDRRAFVTSGLLSLGVALAVITRETGMDVSSISAFAFLSVGVIVLLLGTGWQMLRGYFVAAMPEAMQRRLPPVR